MKHKTSDLNPGLLDAAVAKAQGWEFSVQYDTWPNGEPTTRVFVTGALPSSDWSRGMQIVERERVKVTPFGDVGWRAVCPANLAEHGPFFSESFLIAAMRAYVASKMGDEVELP